MSESATSRTAVYGPVRTVVWQGSVGDRRPYADLVTQCLRILGEWKRIATGLRGIRKLLFFQPRAREVAIWETSPPRDQPTAHIRSFDQH